MSKDLGLFSSKQLVKKLRFLPFALVGIAVFTLNVNPDTNPYLQIYITLLEAKVGVVLVYFLTKKLGNMGKDKQSI
ncbi:sugar ABC transporter substrate-binding protein [Pseudanabaena sp. UWO310]|jgi:hypothetical protein|uniref:sugar ABC transporter substrate-binding protein n=1 Tax=Pseudanabaena sp. UWO310 TaxID=2480795 RepID=UPI001158916D|nr:sugar ABC transporter substrate-binding protein [Pseudanabaena sp. UWO310]TYQ30077.1 hypothetical protein PseudUWO310_10455 [Pseudanabaena sp. UWO310]